MKGKVTFNKSGSGSTSCRLTIPAAFVEIMGITKDEREVEISFKDGKLIIEKVDHKVTCESYESYIGLKVTHDSYM